ncbi:MAG: hypothetical protein AAGI53_07950 [Planctomycetota bacterium]
MKTSAITVAVLAGAAAAQTGTFFAFQGDTLYRGDLGTGTASSFTLSDDIIAAEFNGAGELLAHSSPFAPGTPESFRVDNAFGANPTLTALGSGSQDPSPSSVEFINGRAYGFDSQGNFNEYDPNTLALIAQIAPQQQGVGGNGLGYDVASDTLYMVDRNNDALFVVDVATGNLTNVGGLGTDIQNAGATFFGGQLWASYQNNSTGNYEVGTIDTSTGALTSVFTLDTFGITQPPLTVAFAIIPAPGGAALLGLAGLAAARRRR